MYAYSLNHTPLIASCYFLRLRLRFRFRCFLRFFRSLYQFLCSQNACSELLRYFPAFFLSFSKTLVLVELFVSAFQIFKELLWTQGSRIYTSLMTPFRLSKIIIVIIITFTIINFHLSKTWSERYKSLNSFTLQYHYSFLGFLTTV